MQAYWNESLYRSEEKPLYSEKIWIRSGILHKSNPLYLDIPEKTKSKWRKVIDSFQFLCYA